MYNLDVKDKKLLYELDNNARQSIPQISKKLGLHNNVVRYRINRLEKLGIIKEYYTVIDSYKLGYFVIKFYTQFQNISSNIKNEIINYLKNSEITWVVASLEGEFDLDAIFWVRDINEFYTFWELTLQQFGKYFKDPRILYQIQAISYKNSFLLDLKERPENEKFEVSGQVKKIVIDDIDYDILKILSSNARIPSINLSKKLNLSSNTIKYRLRHLIKLDIIQGFRANIDFSKLGYINVKADLFLNNFNNKQKLIHYVKKHPNLLCIMNSIGYSNLELEFNVKNTHQFYEIMREIIDNNPDAIQNYKYFIIIENYKLRWIPTQ
jgi:Lrp/AsnC family transcriptional regulator for asnA, asnC and gidA